MAGRPKNSYNEKHHQKLIQLAEVKKEDAPVKKSDKKSI